MKLPQSQWVSDLTFAKTFPPLNQKEMVMLFFHAL